MDVSLSTCARTDVEQAPPESTAPRKIPAAEDRQWQIHSRLFAFLTLLSPFLPPSLPLPLSWVYARALGPSSWEQSTTLCFQARSKEGQVDTNGYTNEGAIETTLQACGQLHQNIYTISKTQAASNRSGAAPSPLLALRYSRCPRPTRSTLPWLESSSPTLCTLAALVAPAQQGVFFSFHGLSVY